MTVDWQRVAEQLDADGVAVIPSLFDTAQCAEATKWWEEPRRFRSTVDMARYRFGSGEYRYLAAPLPPLVATLRTQAYRHLVPIANRWGTTFPPTLPAFLAHCAAHGQTRPTPLLLRYGPGDYNCLHQDLYGAVAFPLQMTILLGDEFEGGEIVLVEQRPRAQSRATVIALERGDAVVLPNRHRPVQGAKGTYRVTVRHGVSTIRSGTRMTLGVIFHDAE
ncbi:MAG TPA: 2OG-Fe(II) oxygenase [Candidatus Binatia bacterium]|jgi:hypothetical protein|nr:2OG-Fe(II) oxygenase [Candidatus Binatia bacterium]